MEATQVNQFLASEDQVRVHIRLLHRIAHLDGEFSEGERQFLERIVSIYSALFPNLDVSALESCDDEEMMELLECLEGRTSKMILLQDLVGMAFADGEMHDAEKEFLFDVADQMSLSAETVEDLIALNEEVLDANKRLSEFIYCNEL
jgi:uncharacterized tellurite resistance protein B-like protein